MITKVSEGTWEVGVSTINNLSDKEHIVIACKENTSKIIASTGLAGAEDELESIANAQLMAASKDMYRIIELMLERLANLDGDYPIELEGPRKQLEEALKKAEGK